METLLLCNVGSEGPVVPSEKVRLDASAWIYPESSDLLQTWTLQPRRIHAIGHAMIRQDVSYPNLAFAKILES